MDLLHYRSSDLIMFCCYTAKCISLWTGQNFTGYLGFGKNLTEKVCCSNCCNIWVIQIKTRNFSKFETFIHFNPRKRKKAKKCIFSFEIPKMNKNSKSQNQVWKTNKNETTLPKIRLFGQSGKNPQHLWKQLNALNWYPTPSKQGRLVRLNKNRNT